MVQLLLIARVKRRAAFRSKSKYLGSAWRLNRLLNNRDLRHNLHKRLIPTLVIV